MNDKPDEMLRHAVDRVVLSGRRVFGWGWAVHPLKAVKAINFRFQGDGWERLLPAGIGLAREDVERVFPGYVNSGCSGFVIAGHVPENARHSWLEIELEEGSRSRFDVSDLVDTRSKGRRKQRLITWAASAAWRRLKRGDILGVIRRAKALAGHYAVPSIGDMAVVESVVGALQGVAAVRVFFDHNMGGGANHYRRRMIAERLAAHDTVLLCTYHLPILEYRLHVMRPDGGEQVFGLSTFQVIERILDRVPVKELFVNSPVSFDEPLLFADWLARMRETHRGVRLTMTAHDYFFVCPSFVLLNHRGQYCGIPEMSECASCLKQHRASYVALSPPTEIGPWRSLWARCLGAADEVRFFSESSRAKFLRAYPSLATGHLTVIPHKPDYVPARLPRTDPSKRLVIGVLGEISEQKGASIVNELVQLIDRKQADARVVVLGTLHMPVKSERLHVTGTYDRADLVDLVESHGINVFLFPSIWPETYSYVVAEIVALAMPIVAFDLGAPAERLASYANARICREVSAPAALAALLEFHEELARSGLVTAPG